MNLTLHDQIKEYQLQYLWSRLKSEVILKTIDGKVVKIVYPGVWNKEEGPDFKNAVIEISGKEVKGDIEVHIKADDWLNHGHFNDKRYSDVVLHIVQKCSERDMENSKLPNIPTVHLVCSSVLKNKFDSIDKYPPGSCAELFSELDDSQLKKIFFAAGLERFKEKAVNAVEAILKYGVDQALLLNIFDALGYKKNRVQFKELLRRFLQYDIERLSDLEVAAVLWGESGLLPDLSYAELDNEIIKEYAAGLWEVWWKLRRGNNEQIEWTFSGVRPVNTPHRRIAAGIVLLKKMGTVSTFSKVLERFHAANTWNKYKEFIICSDRIWDGFSSFHYLLNRKAAVLGEFRALDIVVNVLLPLFYAYGEINNCTELKKKTVDFYKVLPAGQKNIIYEMSAQRWLIPKERAGRIFTSMAIQQGVIYIHRKYCKKLSMNCSKCQLKQDIVY